MIRTAACLVFAIQLVGCTTPARSKPAPPTAGNAPVATRSKARCKTTPLTMGNSKGDEPTMLAVASEVDGYVLYVPNAPDWKWACGPGVVLKGISEEARLQVTVDVIEPDGRDLAPEPYLRDIASNVTRAMSRAGVSVVKTEIFRPHDITLMGMTLETASHEREETYWTMRHRADGRTVDLHITPYSHNERERESQRNALSVLMSLFTVNGQKETFTKGE